MRVGPLALNGDPDGSAIWPFSNGDPRGSPITSLRLQQGRATVLSGSQPPFGDPFIWRFALPP